MTDRVATVLCDTLVPGGTALATTPILTENTFLEENLITEVPGGITSDVLFHVNLLK